MIAYEIKETLDSDKEPKKEEKIMPGGGAGGSRDDDRDEENYLNSFNPEKIQEFFNVQSARSAQEFAGFKPVVTELKKCVQTLTDLQITGLELSPLNSQNCRQFNLCVPETKNDTQYGLIKIANNSYILRLQKDSMSVDLRVTAISRNDSDKPRNVSSTDFWRNSEYRGHYTDNFITYDLNDPQEKLALIDTIIKTIVREEAIQNLWGENKPADSKKIRINR